MKKLNNKGFTLVEIVIVIVIIAILAAMLVPSLTQWIDKSKMKTFTSACGTIKTAVASAISEQYATDSTVSQINQVTNAAGILSADVGKNICLGTSLAEGAAFAVNADANANSMTITDGKFTGVWNGSTWNVTKGS